jgi:predicted Na+-dependent transporter
MDLNKQCADAGGFGLGYAVARLVRVEEKQARTMSIEVASRPHLLLVSMHFC